MPVPLPDACSWRSPIWPKYHRNESELSNVPLKEERIVLTSLPVVTKMAVVARKLPIFSSLESIFSEFLEVLFATIMAAFRSSTWTTILGVYLLFSRWNSLELVFEVEDDLINYAATRFLTIDLLIRFIFVRSRSVWYIWDQAPLKPVIQGVFATI